MGVHVAHEATPCKPSKGNSCEYKYAWVFGPMNDRKKCHNGRLC